MPRDSSCFRVIQSWIGAHPPTTSRNLAVINGTWELPLGHGKAFLGSADGLADKIVSGWSLSAITTLQSGLPFTPQLGYNPSNNGDSRDPIRPSWNPAFTGPVILGGPNRVFQPQCVSPSGGRHLRRRGTRCAVWTGPRGSGFFGSENHPAHREDPPAVPCGVLQHPESRQFRVAERSCVLFGVANAGAHRGSHHLNVNYLAADSIRPKAAMVVSHFGGVQKLASDSGMR